MNMSPSLVEESPLAALSAYLSQHSELSILQHFLSRPLPNAPSLLNDAVFVGLDMEWWERQPASITETGFAVFKGSDLLAYDSSTMSLLDLLQKFEFFHTRIIETCHMENRILAPIAAHYFGFGSTRWMYQMDAISKAAEMFTQWRCADGSPAPVILLGHGLRDDIKNLRVQWGVDLCHIPNIVYTLETSPLAHQAKLIEESQAKLEVLVDRVGVTPKHLHNAGNDIAYTAIVALLIGLKDEPYVYPKPEEVEQPGKASDEAPHNSNRSAVQPVAKTVDALIKLAKSEREPPAWGLPFYCYRCESEEHPKKHCTAIIQGCAFCERVRGTKNKKFREKATSHNQERCANAPYIYKEPLPDWVRERLTRKERVEFRNAVEAQNTQALGVLVMKAYQSMYIDDEDENKQAGAVVCDQAVQAARTDEGSSQGLDIEERRL